MVLEEIQTRTSSKYFKLLEKLVEMKQGRYVWESTIGFEDKNLPLI